MNDLMQHVSDFTLQISRSSEEEEDVQLANAIREQPLYGMVSSMHTILTNTDLHTLKMKSNRRRRCATAELQAKTMRHGQKR